MTWREQLRKVRLADGRELVGASFRGVPFFVHFAEGETGRRTVVHQYPLRDQPQPEDMGRETEQYSVDAYVIGDDYMADRDALRNALRLGGPGVLIHPYYGELNVSVLGRVRWSESTSEGGMARFSMTFVEDEGVQYPTVNAGTQAAASDSVDAAEAASADEFAGTFSTEGPSFIATEALAIFSDSLDAMREALTAVTALPEGLTDFADALTEAAASASALMQAPADLAATANDLVRQLRAAAGQPQAAIVALRSLFGFGSDLPAVDTSTPNRQLQAANQAMLAGLIQQAAALEAVRATSEIEFESLDDALALRDELIEELDTIAESVTTSELYNALSAARAAMAADIGARGADLARLIKLKLPESSPAIVVAFDLYGDANRDAEIIARNRVENPLLVPGGRPLEFLADA